MNALRRALIADGSKVCLQLFSHQLKALVPTIQTASSVDGAMAALEAGPAVDLVLSDMLLPGGGALELLRRLDASTGPRPLVAVLGRGGADEANEVSLAGAVVHLGKPLKPGSFARLFWQLREPAAISRLAAQRFEYSSPVVATALDDEGHQIIECEVRNLSRSGALLLTHGPMEVGCELRLQLRQGQRLCELRAVVVRVQEPSWGTCPGIAVGFTGDDPGAELACLLEAAS